MGRQPTQENCAPRFALAIAASTGGPAALQVFFSGLAALCDAEKIVLPPVFVTQHMPADFLPPLAAQIAAQSGLVCRTAVMGERVQGAHIYIAPGDVHLGVRRVGHYDRITLSSAPPVHFCRPAADPMLCSLAEVYGKNTLAVILTGMGMDGLTGCQHVAAAGGTVMAQDENSSVIWGMPGAVSAAGLCRDVLPLTALPAAVVRWVAQVRGCPA